MEYLGIRLGATLDNPIHWIVWSDSENEIIASGALQSAADLESLKSKANDPHIIAIAPSSQIGFKAVELPSKASRKVLQAVPFMLEEDVAEDINDLFFAFGGKTANTQHVAYCRKDTLTMWQQAFTDAGLFCDKLVPDVLCIPYQTDSTSVLQIEQDLIVRNGAFSGIQGEASWLLSLVSKQVIDTDTSVTLFNELDDVASLEAESISVQNNFELLPMLLLLKGAQGASLNLFQNEFAVKRQSNAHWKKWRIAAAVAAIALSVNMVDTQIQISKLENERAKVRDRIAVTTKQGFPELGKVLNHRRMISREMQALQQGGSGVSMLNMLAQLSPVFSQTGVSPQSIRFDGTRSELRMQSVARSFESLEKFKRDVQQLGYTVEQGAINNKGDQVTGAIVIKG